MKSVWLCVLVSFSLLLCCACASEQAAAVLPQGTASVVMPTASPTPSVSPSPTFAINPVSAFYTAYQQDTRDAMSALKEQLAKEQSIAALDTAFALTAHNANVSKARVSIGRLSLSGGVYADTLLGAAAGSGRLYAEREHPDVYAFRFIYDDGVLMQGTLTADCLFFSLHTTATEETVTNELDAETGEMAETVTQNTVIAETLRADMLKKEENNAWLSCHYEAGLLSVLRFAAESADFYTAAPDAALYPLSETDADTLALLAVSPLIAENMLLTYSVHNHS